MISAGKTHHLIQSQTLVKAKTNGTVFGSPNSRTGGEFLARQGNFYACFEIIKCRSTLVNRTGKNICRDEKERKPAVLTIGCRLPKKDGRDRRVSSVENI